MYKIILGLGLIVPLAACQTMSVTECQTANWSELGRQDGLKGYDSRLDTRVKSCNKQSISIDLPKQKQYVQSYQSAILQYCQPENIYRLSMLGDARIFACPEPNYSQVRTIYEVGNRYYQHKTEIESLRKQIKDQDAEIDNISDKEQRYKLLEQQRENSKKLQRLLDEQVDLDRELQLVKPI